MGALEPFRAMNCVKTGMHNGDIKGTPTGGLKSLQSVLIHVFFSIHKELHSLLSSFYWRLHFQFLLFVLALSCCSFLLSKSCQSFLCVCIPVHSSLPFVETFPSKRMVSPRFSGENKIKNHLTDGLIEWINQSVSISSHNDSPSNASLSLIYGHYISLLEVKDNHILACCSLCVHIT